MGEKIDSIREEQRVSMNIALSSADKKFLKVYAAEHDTTVAAVIAACIEKLRNDGSKKKGKNKGKTL